VFVLATVALRSAAQMMEWSSLRGLNLPSLLARAKQHRSAERVTAIPLVQTKLAKPRAMWQPQLLADPHLKARHSAA
jgi:hypothetical protein